MKLYSYFRSSASYRVRIALNLKGLKAEMVPVNLLKNEQKGDDYTSLNPQGLLPTLIDEGHALTQSLSIIEYLEEKYPSPALLPTTPHERARVRALSLAIACEIAPVNNLGVQRYLTDTLRLHEEQKLAWIQHWIAQGFTSLEKMLQSDDTGSFCHGSQPGMADCVLVPQVFNALRFKLDLSPYPTIRRIFDACEKHPAFIAAHPSKQVDA